MIKNEFRTMADYQRAVKELAAPLKKDYSPGKAHLITGSNAAHYGVKTCGLEGFSRILWGLVPLWASGETSDLDGYIPEGIAHGTDRNHPEYWGDYGDGEQAYVEMGALAYGILLAPEQVWETLSEEEKTNFQNWLLQINAHKISDNNWLFFRILVNCGLRQVHAAYDSARLEADLERIDDFYLGDGWYSDGMTNQRDYYIGFAMHFYSLVYAKLMEKEDPVRSQKYKERAALFAQSFLYWFGSRGEALPYGRSLTYRFAQGCFWSALVFAEVEIIPWGMVKGIINRHFRYWFSRPILDGENQLTLGYAYPNLTMCEGYNSSESPYWAMKSFLLLAVPGEHPFWQAEELPLPVLEPVVTQPHAGMVIQRGGDGYVTALASGQYAEWEPVHCAEKYEKFAYSSYFGFQVPRSYYNLSQAAPDNMLAFRRDGYYHVRRRCDEVRCQAGQIWSKWRPMEGVVVETLLVPWERGHIRTHVIHADEACTAVEGGFALPWEEAYEITQDTAEGRAAVSGPAGSSRIQLQEGHGTGGVIFCEANTNLVHPRTVLPYLTYEIPAGTTTIRVYVEGVPGHENSDHASE